MKRILFVCSANLNRSPTAEIVFSSYPGIEVASAGVMEGACVPLTAERVRWADIIFVMEKCHKEILGREFGTCLQNKVVHCLDIPDMFPTLDPILVGLLKEKVTPLLNR